RTEAGGGGRSRRRSRPRGRSWFSPVPHSLLGELISGENKIEDAGGGDGFLGSRRCLDEFLSLDKPRSGVAVTVVPGRKTMDPILKSSGRCESLRTGVPARSGPNNALRRPM